MISMTAMAEVTISGWLNEGLNYYDDGNVTNFSQSSDNGTTLGSRITFAAKSDLPAGLNAGVELIIEPESLQSPLITSNQNGGSLTGSFLTDTGIGTNGGASLSNNGRHALRVLGNSIYFGGAFGKFTIGKLSPASDNIAVLDDPSLTLWSTISPVFRGNSFTIQNLAGSANGVGLLDAVGLTTIGTTWGDFMSCMGTNNALVGGAGIGIDCGDGDYNQGLRYDLPTFIPNLSIAASYGNKDMYDVSGKYHNMLGRLKWSISMGYTYSGQGGVIEGFNETDPSKARTGGSDTYQMQTGLMDPVTGLFGSVAYQHESANNVTAAAKAAVFAASGGTLQDETDAWWFKGGIKKAFNSLGDTSISFNYGQMDDQYTFVSALDGVTGSQVERIGASIDQYFGSSLIIYGNWQRLSLNVDQSAVSFNSVTNNFQTSDDLDFFTLGLTYFF
jgi:hypothetical protein